MTMRRPWSAPSSPQETCSCLEEPPSAQIKHPAVEYPLRPLRRRRRRAAGHAVGTTRPTPRGRRQGGDPWFVEAGRAGGAERRAQRHAAAPPSPSPSSEQAQRGVAARRRRRLAVDGRRRPRRAGWRRSASPRRARRSARRRTRRALYSKSAWSTRPAARAADRGDELALAAAFSATRRPPRVGERWRPSEVWRRAARRPGHPHRRGQGPASSTAALLPRLGLRLWQ